MAAALIAVLSFASCGPKRQCGMVCTLQDTIDVVELSTQYLTLLQYHDYDHAAKMVLGNTASQEDESEILQALQAHYNAFDGEHYKIYDIKFYSEQETYVYYSICMKPAREGKKRNTISAILRMERNKGNWSIADAMYSNENTNQ